MRKNHKSKDTIKIVSQDSSRPKERQGAMTELVFLLGGVLGLLFLLDAMQGASFAYRIVYPVTAGICFFLWFGFYRSRKGFVIFTLVLFFSCAILTASMLQPLREQSQYILEILLGTQDLEAMDITELALLLSALLSLTLFCAEFIVKSHALLYLLITGVLLCSPFLGVRITVPALFLLVLFQIAFWSIRVSDRQKDKTVLLSKNSHSIAKKTGTAITLVLAVIFAIAAPLISVYAQPMYNASYEAEGFVYRTLNSLSGKSGDSITGGRISRGNNYLTGASHLELNASSKPTETLYLRGFGGGEYIGGDWIRSSDEALFARMDLSSEGQDLSYGIATMYYGMYFVMNQSMLSEEPPEPITLTIRHTSGVYETSYVPYYSRRGSSYGSYFYQDQTSAGYSFQYFEQGDMKIDWENVSEEFEAQRDSYLELQEAYIEQAMISYTQVPTELLPRLTALTEENPLTELNEITAFILYTLESNASYSLTPGWTAFNKDVIECFLFERGRGYCVHFAATATLMYRLYGIPARYATGYVVLPSDFVPGDNGTWQATVTDEAAHAWAEIFLPGYGWTPVEVTPASDGNMIAAYPGFDGLEFERILGEKSWDANATGLTEHEIESPYAYEDASADWFFELPEINTEKYRDVFLVLGTCFVYSLLLVPLFLDYRRLQKRRKFEEMNSRMIFFMLTEALHFCKKLTECDGAEADFSLLLAQEIPDIDVHEAEHMLEIVRKAAYGREENGANDANIVLNVYKKAVRSLYGGLNLRLKFIFRYIKAFD